MQINLLEDSSFHSDGTEMTWADLKCSIVTATELKTICIIMQICKTVQNIQLLCMWHWPLLAGAERLWWRGQTAGCCVVVLWSPCPLASCQGAETSAPSAEVWPERCWAEPGFRPAGLGTTSTPAAGSPGLGLRSEAGPREWPALEWPTGCWAEPGPLCSAAAVPVVTQMWLSTLSSINF